jgi:hypothetical protein
MVLKMLWMKDAEEAAWVEIVAVGRGPMGDQRKGFWEFVAVVVHEVCAFYDDNFEVADARLPAEVALDDAAWS